MKKTENKPSNVISLKDKRTKHSKQTKNPAFKKKFAILFQWVAIILTGYLVLRSCGLAK